MTKTAGSTEEKGLRRVNFYTNVTTVCVGHERLQTMTSPIIFNLNDSIIARPVYYYITQRRQ